MNSMFSCFDTFCAEVVLGKSVTANAGAYYAVARDAKSPPRRDGATEKTIGKKSEGNGELAEMTKTKMKKPQMIRSAPEFDGLDCFETLVPY